MASDSKVRRARLWIDVEPELRRKIKVAAAERESSIRDYVVAILQRALAEEERGEGQSESAAWTRLATRSFARDWDSDEDRVYDELS